MILPHNLRCVYWGFLFAVPSVDTDFSICLAHCKVAKFFIVQIVLCLHYFVFESGFLSVHWVRLQLCQSTADLVAKSLFDVPLCRLYVVVQMCEYSPRILVFHSLTTIQEQTTSLR